MNCIFIGHELACIQLTQENNVTYDVVCYCHEIMESCLTKLTHWRVVKPSSLTNPNTMVCVLLFCCYYFNPVTLLIFRYMDCIMVGAWCCAVRSWPELIRRLTWSNFQWRRCGEWKGAPCCWLWSEWYQFNRNTLTFWCLQSLFCTLFL